MVLARLFYFIFLGLLFLLLLVEFSRLIFSNETLLYRWNRFLSGITIALFWPLALLSPKGRKHFSLLVKFVFAKNGAETIDVQSQKNNTSEKQHE